MMFNDSEDEGLVISGMAGRFPESDNVYQYRDNLQNKKNMVTLDYRRWKTYNTPIPNHSGKINFLEKFDSGFFGVHYHQVHSMDTVGRLLVEHTFEAIVDAGYHPDELKSSRTGVFIALCLAESENYWFYKNQSSHNFGGTGCQRSMQPQWISQIFQFEGPSVCCDTACSSSLSAVDLACRAINIGECDSAVVGAGTLCLNPNTTLQFHKLGMLSKNGACKAFDKDADGFVKSEAVSVIFLQKMKDARRIYAHIVHIKVNCDGYKQHGIMYPSDVDKKLLYSEFYNECNVDPNTVYYVEAHATGTKVGDPIEILAMDTVYCTSRQEPLYVGSVKSNHGHAEPVSGLCSITKVLLSMENDYLLPNINFKKSEFDPLIKGRMIVVTELTSWPKEKSDLAAVNNFGFGGVNIHVLLKRNKKLKISNGLPEDDLPRLVCFSGRTHESIESIWNDLNNRPLDHEHIRLLNEVFSKPIMGHPYRGFSILSKKEELFRSSAYNDKICRSLYLVLGAPNKKVICFAKSIRKFPAFNNQLQRIQSLLPTNINIFALVDDDWKNSNLDLFSATIFIQVALIELFKLLEVKFDRVIGHSTGIIATSYAQGILTLDETILTVCHIIKCMSPYNNNNVANRVHLGNHKRTILPSDFEIISHNSGQNYTIVATKEEMQRLTENLCTKGIRLSRANTLETFFKYKEDISSQLVQRLENVMTLSQRFVDLFFNVDDPLLNFPIDSVVVHDTNMDQLPTSIALAPNNCSNEYFLTSLGKLYELGYNPLLHVLFPKVEWPVSRGTPMISPLIKWNHSNDWFVPYYKMQKNLEKGKSSIEISSKDPNWTFVTGHIIDDRNLFPATAYLQIVWETFSIIHDIPINDLSVTFKNIRFRRATNLLSDKSVKFLIMIQQKTGLFGVVESKELTVSGEIYKGTRAAVELPIYYEDNEKQLSKKEIYKELKLRGYNYSGLFTGIECCNLSATRGTIEWTGNWTAFMDNMLQIKILQTDIRNLYVPTYIEQVSINTDIHKKMSNKISVYVNKDVDIIKCSGVEITGLRVNAIARRKTFKKPVLETYKFIPLEGKLSLKNAITVNAQIILENNTKIKFKAVELLSNDVPIMPMLLEILQNQPLLQTDLLVVTQSELTLEGIAITDKKPENDSYLLVITSGALTEGNIMREALDAVKNNGYVLSREKVDFDLNNVELNVISFYETGDEKIVLFQKSFHQKEFTLIDISNSEGFEWLPKVQCAVKDNKQLLLLGHNQSNSGILGFINCLKQELYAQKPPMCVFLMDNKQHYDMQNPFYTEQLKKGLTINVHKDNVWGTYRHLLLEESAVVQSEHIFNNTLTRGDLSSLTWLEGPLNYTAKIPLEKTIVHINYSALNFRDIMIASGRLQPDIITTNRIEQQNLQGIEFSGMLDSGKRVMGVAQTGALANIVLSEKAFMTEVPNHWTYEDAATVTAAYCTTLICLEKVGAITKEKSILIHAGTGGVGLSAINIALHYGCEIFTTVGTAEKKAYLLEHFPQIPETHIGHSRDTSFELMILKCTKGRGVDLVLNSLAEEKLQASLRCLAPRGRFLEIGKFDLQNNSNLQNDVIAHGRSFHSVMLDVFYNTIPAQKTYCMKLLKRGIAGGYVKPLPRRVFEKDDIQQAFRHMAAGKHIGKVLIKIRDENKLFYGLPRFYCNDTYTSIIIGGLGGFGLELADWLVLRGCKKLILVSRSGVKNGYQAFKISQWKKYKVLTHISTADVTTEKGCVRLIEEAHNVGPVECIFNLAVVLKDAILENQTEDSFKTAFAPKVLATKHLDAVSRKMCPMIRKFVVFSSVVSGRGNAGQTNYGMANSVMERICENRKSDGYHALAIQWGAIGDVGLVADMLELRDNIEIGGTLPQKISSCLAVLDEFLNQDEVIVSSMVVADKKPTTAAVGGLVHAIMNIIGVKDLKNIGEHTTLSELGMDSIMTVEINQVLERGHEIVLNPQEVRSLTFTKLKEMERKEVDSTVIYSNTIINPKYELLHVFLLNMVEEAREFQPMVRLKSLVQESVAAPTLLILPGIDGNYCNFEPLAANLSCHVFCLQYDDNYTMDHTIDQIAEYLLSCLHGYLSSSAPFVIAAYSMSSVMAVHLVSVLEKEGKTGHLILIDGSPQMLQTIITHLIPDTDNKHMLQSFIMTGFVKSYIAFSDILKLKNSLLKCIDFDEQMDLILEHVPKRFRKFPNHTKNVVKSAFGRCKAIITYKPKFKKLKTIVTLIKPKKALLSEISHDYDLQNLCQAPVQVHVIEGNHHSMLKSDNLQLILNKIVNNCEAARIE